LTSNNLALPRNLQPLSSHTLTHALENIRFGYRSFMMLLLLLLMVMIVENVNHAVLVVEVIS